MRRGEAVTHRRPRPWTRLTIVATLLAVPACGGSGDGDSESITVYTCVNEETIDPVVDRFEQDNPDVDVKVFRAPTGELNARVAGDVRSGGLKADVIWACDPLTMQAYADQDLVGGWVPSEATQIPAEYRTADWTGVALLYLVAITHEGETAPQAWSDLAGGHYDSIAIPDPSVAASALGALGYFSQQPDYGLQFYEDLQLHGADQLSTPDDVVAGVAQGTYQAGITIANSAYAARTDGSPIEVTWPEPGAIAVYGPIAIARESADSDPARDFVSFVVSRPGQELVGRSGSYPTLPGAERPTIPDDAPVVAPDWSELGSDKDALLADYQRIMGG